MNNSLQDLVQGVKLIAQLNAEYIKALKDAGFTEDQAKKLCKAKGVKLFK